MNEPGLSPFSDALLAFIETSAGGVPQVRYATGRVVFSEPWTAPAGSFNADPAVPAGEPTAWAYGNTVVAWVEGGQVRARAANGVFGSGVFSDAVVLNLDPASVARSPRATRTLGNEVAVVFVEAGPSGDEIRAQRWDGTTWTLLPGALNAGVPGAVRALSVSPGPTIAWTDDQDHVFVRVASF